MNRNGGIRPRKRMAWLPPASAVVAAVLLCGCADCGSGEVITSYPQDGSDLPSLPARIVIEPPFLVVEAGSIFELRARVYTGENDPLVGATLTAAPSAPPITFEPQSALSQDAQTPMFMSANLLANSDYSAVYQAGSPSAIGEIEIRATADGFEDGVARIIILPDFNPPNDEMIETNPSRVPSIAVIDGESAGEGCFNDHVLAFVGRGYFPNLSADCTNPVLSGSWGVFSEGAAVRFDSHSWDSALEDVPIPSRTSLTSIKLKVWRAATTTMNPNTSVEVNQTLSQFTSMVEKDLNFSRAVFDMNRSGFEFEWDGAINDSAGEVVIAQNMVTYCNDLETSGLFETHPIDTTGQINVIYVRDLPGADKGSSCWNYPVVFVNIASKMPETLAHELAHQLGLRDPNVFDGNRIGHTDYLPGFLPDNLMWRGGRMDWQSPRDQLSVGQVFRMNADKNRSWAVKQGMTPISVDCTHNETDSVPCPRLALDRPESGP